MAGFKESEWETNGKVDETCKLLFGSKKKKTTNNKRANRKRKNEEDTSFDSIKKQLDVKLKEIVAKKAKVEKTVKKIEKPSVGAKASPNVKKINQVQKPHNNKQQNVHQAQKEGKAKMNKIVKNQQELPLEHKTRSSAENAHEEPKQSKNKLRKIDFFGVKRHKSNKTESRKARKRKIQLPMPPLVKKPKPAPLTLREKMMDKLKAARFRYLNEQMYTSEGIDAKKYFETNHNDYKAYHDGYKQQVAKWPFNPLAIIINNIKKMSRDFIIADFGCGEGVLEKSISQKVHSFDLVALDDHVVACDMSHVPLETHSVDVVVFCLSLMGTNLNDYILEANRVLKVGGMVKVAEVESRFDDVAEFVKMMGNYGLTKTRIDLSHNLFYFMDFKKKSDVLSKRHLPNITLKPCLYKKR